MSSETNRYKVEVVDIRKLIRGAAFACLATNRIAVSSLEDLLKPGSDLDTILPDIRQRVVDQGHDFDEFDLVDALTDEDGEAGQEPKSPDDSPEDRGGGSRVPRIRYRPPDGSAGAEVEPEHRREINDPFDIETFFPRPIVPEPAEQVPRVPVGVIIDANML